MIGNDTRAAPLEVRSSSSRRGPMCCRAQPSRSIGTPRTPPTETYPGLHRYSALRQADPARSYRYKDWALYAEDNFRLTPRLTVNYGLRWEHFGVQHNNQKFDSNFYPGAGTYPQNVADGGVFLTSQSPIGEFWSPAGAPSDREWASHWMFLEMARPLCAAASASATNGTSGTSRITPASIHRRALWSASVRQLPPTTYLELNVYHQQRSGPVRPTGSFGSASLPRSCAMMAPTSM